MYPDAVRAMKTVLNRGETFCVFPQNFIEFWNVATRDANRNGLGFTTSQTEAEVSRIEGLLMVVPDRPAIYPEWRRLVVAHSVKDKQVQDTRIATAMIAHRITRLLIFNTDDFKRFTSINAFSPQNIS